MTVGLGGCRRVLVLVLVVALLAQAGAALSAWAAGEQTDLSRYTGIARPRYQVVLAAPTDGLLIRVGPTEGDRVSSGDDVASMDDRIQQQVVALAELQAADTSAVDLAEADVRFYAAELERVRHLERHNAANLREIDIAEIQLEQAHARLRGAKAQAEQAALQFGIERRRLAALRLSAPFDGVVVQRVAQPGSSLRVGDGVLRLAAIDTLWAEIPVPAGLYGRLSVGRRYRLRAGTPVEGPVDATLLRVRPEIDSASETVVATFEIENPGLRMPAGFEVHLTGTSPIEETPATSPAPGQKD